MKKLLLFLLFAVSAHAQQPLDWGDQHNGTYKNPVLNADFSDPDVIRVGDSYYMVASDFHFLGMQVLESKDLVNWQIISQIYDRFDLSGWDSNQHYAGGSWAPAIRFHDGRFYVYFCTPEEGLFMSTSEHAAGPWTPLHCVKKVEKWEDPCPFWDDDGQAYLGRSQHGAGPIIIHRMTPDGRQLLDDGVTVYTGPVAEGTKFLKRNGYYYLIIPEGGVCCGWQTVLRSRNIYGPYEKRVVMEQGSTSINGPHQGALVDTPSRSGEDSQWWFLHFQETHPLGRVVHLQPARWKDDWPLIGVDIDGNGIGEPVAVWTTPQTTGNSSPSSNSSQSRYTSQSRYSSPSRNSSNTCSSGMPCQLSDDFSAGPLYWAGQHQRSLALPWQWNHNPVDTAWSLTERDGWLSLHALPADNLKASRNMLTQKTIGYESEATVRVDCSALQEGDHAGLLCTGKQFMGVGVCRQAGKLLFYLENDGVRTPITPCKQKTVYLRVTIDCRRNTHQFAVSNDGKQYTPVGDPFPLRMGYWKGSRIGLFSYNTTGTNRGKALFDFFHYIIKK